MRRGIFILIVVILAMVFVSASAESVRYTFGDFSLSIPKDHHVFTRENHDVAAARLDSFINQQFADSLFDSQPGLQMNSLCFDPLYELFVFQLPNTMIGSFSIAEKEKLEDYRKLWKGLMQSKQITLTEETQIIPHPQTNFFKYSGTTNTNGQTVYIYAYASCENDIMTTIQLQTYDVPADEGILAVLDEIVQGSVLFGSWGSQPGSSQNRFKTVVHEWDDVRLSMSIPSDMWESDDVTTGEFIDRCFENNDIMIALTIIDMWEPLTSLERAAMGAHTRDDFDRDGIQLKELGLIDMSSDDSVSGITEEIRRINGTDHLIYDYTITYSIDNVTTLDYGVKSYTCLRNGYVFYLQFHALSDTADLSGIPDMVMASIQYPD